MLRTGNHPVRVDVVRVDVLSASGPCVVGSSGLVILMGYSVACEVTFRF